jgi:hypothetical protein
MHKMITKIAIIGAAAAVLSVLPYSMRPSKQTGLTISGDEAQAVIGRPLTPGSVAGVARRTARRHYNYGHHRHCVRVWVNGVHVCR